MKNSDLSSLERILTSKWEGCDHFIAEVQGEIKPRMTLGDSNSIVTISGKIEFRRIDGVSTMYQTTTNRIGDTNDPPEVVIFDGQYLFRIPPESRENSDIVRFHPKECSDPFELPPIPFVGLFGCPLWKYATYLADSESQDYKVIWKNVESPYFGALKLGTEIQMNYARQFDQDSGLVLLDSMTSNIVVSELRYTYLDSPTQPPQEGFAFDSAAFTGRRVVGIREHKERTSAFAKDYIKKYRN